MLPDLSSKPISEVFLTPLRKDNLRDYSWGGIALQDTSKGLAAKLWYSIYHNNAVYLCNGDMCYLVLANLEDVNYLSFTFDQNMRQCIAWSTEGATDFNMYWYSTLDGDFIVSKFNGIQPHLTLDDTRPTMTNLGITDIVLGYSTSDGIEYRIQRERFAVAYKIPDTQHRVIAHMGMTRNLRFRFRHIHMHKYLGE